MNKKAIAILAAIFILIVGTLGFLIIQRRNASTKVTDNPTQDGTTPTPTPSPIPTPEPTPSPTPEPTPTPTPTPTQFGSSPTRLSSEPMISPVLFYQGNGIAYFTPDGRLFQASFTDNAGNLELADLRELAVPARSGISKVRWPLNGNSYLVELGSGSPKRFAAYASNKGEYVDLPPEIVAIDWLPDGEQFVYFWTEASGKASLNVSPSDFSTWNAIVDIWEPDNQMRMAPDGKTILYWRSQATGSTNPINMVTADGKLFRSIVKDGFNTGVIWSPDSKQFAFNKKVSGRQELWIGNMFTGQTLSTGLEVGVDKLVWALDGKKLYAAVPATGGYDELYIVDAGSGQNNLFPILGGMGSAQDLFLSLDGNKLFYYNTQDVGLFYTDLKSSSGTSAP